MKSARGRTGEDEDAPSGLQDNATGTAVAATDADRNADDPKRGVNPLRDLSYGYVSQTGGGERRRHHSRYFCISL